MLDAEFGRSDEKTTFLEVVFKFEIIKIIIIEKNESLNALKGF